MPRKISARFEAALKKDTLARGDRWETSAEMFNKLFKQEAFFAKLLKQSRSKWTPKTLQSLKIVLEHDPIFFSNMPVVDPLVSSSLIGLSKALDNQGTNELSLVSDKNLCQHNNSRQSHDIFAMRLINLFGLNEGDFRVFPIQQYLSDELTSQVDPESLIVSILDPVTHATTFVMVIVSDDSSHKLDSSQMVYELLAVSRKNPEDIESEIREVFAVHIGLDNSFSFFACRLPSMYFDNWDTATPIPTSIRYITTTTWFGALECMEKLSLHLGAEGLRSSKAIIEKSRLHPFVLSEIVNASTLLLDDVVKLRVATKLIQEISDRELLQELETWVEETWTI